MIKKCTCKHDFQDSRYGQGMRQHTVSKKGDERCTVCHPSKMTLKMRSISMNHKPIHG